MENIFEAQILQIANLLNDCNPRTSKMIAKELNLKNSSVSKHLTTLHRNWEFIRVEKIDYCPITGNKAMFYMPIIWVKKKGV